MSDFIQTKMGQIFYNKHLPQLVSNLQNIGKSLETIAGSLNRPEPQAFNNRLIVLTMQEPTDPDEDTIVIFEIIDPVKWRNRTLVATLKELVTDYCRNTADGREWIEDLAGELNWYNAWVDCIDSPEFNQQLLNLGIQMFNSANYMAARVSTSDFIINRGEVI